MFKSLQWKIVAIFILLVLAIMSVAGTFLIISVTGFYHSMFAGEMDEVFTEPFISQLVTGTAEDRAYIVNTMNAYKVRLGMDSYRNYYIISADDSTVIDSSSDQYEPLFSMRSDNLITALSGQIGKEVGLSSSIMDYAVPIRGDGFSYIIYIEDSKEELTAIIQRIFSFILEALLLGMAIALIAGFFLSKTITTPIANLTKKANRISEGEFESKIEVKSDDEIGILTTSFNDMSSKLQGAMLQMSTEKNKIEAILLNMTDGVMAFAVDGSIIHINPTAKKMFGIKDDEELDFDTFFAERQVDIHLGDMLYLEDNHYSERDIELDHISLKASFAVFEDEFDNTGGVLAVFHDVTRQQKLENSRREFVANVSHELRTPLTTVKSYAETLLDMLNDADVPVTFLNTILNETDRMTRMVKDLLILSSLEQPDQLKKTKFNLSAMVSDVVSTMELVAREQGHRLVFVASEPVENFCGDRDKLEQLLYNIISNSIKYTKNGGKIEVSLAPVFGKVHICVKDNGIGIPEKDLKRIFERFYRVDKARSRKQGGTGLGLAISKSIVDAHEGTISINSTVNKGTEVTISLPLLPL